VLSHDYAKSETTLGFVRQSDPLKTSHRQIVLNATHDSCARAERFQVFWKFDK